MIILSKRVVLEEVKNEQGIVTGSTPSHVWRWEQYDDNGSLLANMAKGESFPTLANMIHWLQTNDYNEEVIGVGHDDPELVTLSDEQRAYLGY